MAADRREFFDDFRQNEDCVYNILADEVSSKSAEKARDKRLGVIVCAQFHLVKQKSDRNLPLFLLFRLLELQLS